MPQETKAESDSDDDLEQVAAIQRTLKPPTITSVGQATRWIAKPHNEKTGTASISMCFFGVKKFKRGWFLTMIDQKRAKTYAKAKQILDELSFAVRNKYFVSVTLYLVPCNAQGEPDTIPDITFREGSILHFSHVTGLKLHPKPGIPGGNVSGTERITEEAVGSLPADKDDRKAAADKPAAVQPAEQTIANSQPQQEANATAAPSLRPEAVTTPPGPTAIAPTTATKSPAQQDIAPTTATKSPAQQDSTEAIPVHETLTPRKTTQPATKRATTSDQTQQKKKPRRVT